MDKPWNDRSGSHWTLPCPWRMRAVHSEIKTDMDLERLPSGKFEPNELVLELAMLSYNIWRMIGQESIGRRGQPLSIRSDAEDCAR
ncbi:MAG: hypothetical protein K2I07_00595 [Lachnospiraceae bacterium]|nr:hypothetical protein [Lachnospiraceae bacterium]